MSYSKTIISFNITSVIDGIFALNNSKISDHVDRIYPIQLEIKDTKDKALHPSSLDIYLEISSDCKLRTIPYDNEMISIFSL